MKVCVISSKACWKDHGGVWKTDGGFPIQMQGIASIFDEIELLVVQTTRRSGGLSLPPQATVIPLAQPCGADLRRKLSVVLRLPYYLSKIAVRVIQADAVHVPLPGDIPTLGFALGMLFRKRLLVRYCGSWAETTQTTWMNRILKSCMRSFASKRLIMLVTGDGERPPAPGLHWIFASALSRKEVDECPVDFDRALARPARLVYIGRLSPEKGVAVLLRALSILKQQGLSPLPLLMLAGDGPERPRLEQMVRQLGLEELVRFAGQLNRSELAALLANCDVCVQPSHTEGFSKAWLDAMARGIPVLASNVGAAEAVIGGDGVRGWLTPPGDAVELAQKLTMVLQNSIDWPPLRKRCWIYAQSRTVESWSERISQICAAHWGNQTKQERP